MTDTCATCASYLAQDSTNGICRFNPPVHTQWPNKVFSYQWCAQFSLQAERGSGSVISVSSAANTGNVFLYIVKADGSLWLSTTQGISWTQVTLP